MKIKEFHFELVIEILQSIEDIINKIRNKRILKQNKT